MSLDPDDKEKRRVTTTRVIEAVRAIEALSQGRGLQPDSPQLAAFHAALNRLQSFRAAQAEVLAKAIELLAPLVDGPVGRWVSTVFPGRGTLALGFETAVDLSWLKLNGAFLATAAIELDDRGAMLYRDLYLLEDGRLVELTQLGREGGDTLRTAVLGSRALDPLEASKHYDPVLIFASMDAIARLAREDPEERRARFHSLVQSAAQAVIPATEALDAAIRPG